MALEGWVRLVVWELLIGLRPQLQLHQIALGETGDLEALEVDLLLPQYPISSTRQAAAVSATVWAIQRLLRQLHLTQTPS